MPRRSHKTPGLERRRNIRQYIADVPDVPVVTPDSINSSADRRVEDHRQQALEAEPVDDRIRRMIEAAYT
jgi:hypothetical protein